jgi:hypothetical protein
MAATWIDDRQPVTSGHLHEKLPFISPSRLKKQGGLP